MLSSISSTHFHSTRSYSIGNSDKEIKTSTDRTQESEETSREPSLSRDEQKTIENLKARDREVKTHERAHLSAAGSLAIGGAHYSYETGPDGKQYAVGGDVNIDISEVADDPQATLRKAEKIRSAALAPANPSAQDQRVASNAIAMANKARLELLQQRQQDTGDENESTVGSRIDISV